MTMVGETRACPQCGRIEQQPEITYDDDLDFERGTWTCKGCGNMMVYVSDDDDDEDDDGWFDDCDDEEDDWDDDWD